jgi:hypothetical protein
MNIDHLLAFASEAVAKSALPQYVADGEWNTSVCFPGLTLYTRVPAYDAEGVETVSAQVLPGFWLCISTMGDAPDPALVALSEHRMAAARELAVAGQPFIYPQGLRADPALMAQVVRVDGLPAGSAYPFNQPRVIT